MVRPTAICTHGRLNRIQGPVLEHCDNVRCEAVDI